MRALPIEARCTNASWAAIAIPIPSSSRAFRRAFAEARIETVSPVADPWIVDDLVSLDGIRPLRTRRRRRLGCKDAGDRRGSDGGVDARLEPGWSGAEALFRREVDRSVRAHAHAGERRGGNGLRGAERRGRSAFNGWSSASVFPRSSRIPSHGGCSSTRRDPANVRVTRSWLRPRRLRPGDGGRRRARRSRTGTARSGRSEREGSYRSAPRRRSP